VLRRRDRGADGPTSPIRNWIGLTVLVVLTIVVAVFATTMMLDRTEPSTWGTFTQERCVENRGGCQSIGRWVSDDGSSRLHGVVLDGAPGSDGTVSAFFRPTDTFNVNKPWVVRTQAAEDANIWFPALMLVLLGDAPST